MSMSLRDQLLQAGLISQKQARDAERQQDRQQRRPSKPATPPQAPPLTASPPSAARPNPTKAARDQALNRQQQERAHKKALQAQVKQLIDQNRLTIESDDYFNYVEDKKIRRIAVTAEIRSSLGRGEVVIVRHQGRHSLLPAAVAARVCERDPNAAIRLNEPQATSADVAYAEHPIPDDLQW